MPDLHRDELHATLDRLTKLHGKTTQGEWRVYNGRDIYPADDEQEARFHIADFAPDGFQESLTDIGVSDAQSNAEFSSEAHNAFPSLASTLRSQEARIAELEAKVAQLESLSAVCPDCDGQGWYILPDAKGNPEQIQCRPCEGMGIVALAALASMNTEPTQENP